MNLILALLLLSASLLLCVFVYTDIVEECEWQQASDQAEQLWDDGPPRAENLEASQTIRGTEASSDGY